ncbi:hypothetical protein ZWY2020_027952 [Hordeum vulgare]|nr:hypothetical protein ZWY2020_027952 [Hordeum vulgare]
MAGEKKMFGFEEVAKHNVSKDCWLVIAGKYLDVNRQLILAILNNQNNGKVEEVCTVSLIPDLIWNQAKLQQNLMYLAAMADSQPPQTASLSQSGPWYMPQQSAEMIVRNLPYDDVIIVFAAFAV